MQIHELDTYMGTPSESDYLAIDDGTETLKVPATDLGVNVQMTQAEAEAGTETSPRVVAPSIFKAAVQAIASVIADPKYILDVTISSSTGRATAGEDMDLYNALVDLGWVSDVIETE